MNGGRADNIFKSFIALAIGIVFAVIVSEIILQVIDFPSQPISGWQSCKTKNPGECNSLGFRGKEIAYTDDDFVVLLLGDSELYEPSIPFEQRAEYSLEHFLRTYRDNVKVFTIADMGYGQDQQYLALQKYFKKHRADLVLLMFTVRNDIEDNVFPISGFNKTIKPTFWLKGGEINGPSEGWLEPTGPKLKLALLWQLYVGQKIGESRMEIWKKDILPPSYQGLKHYNGRVDYSWQQMWDSSPQDAFKGIEYERVDHAGTELTPRSELRIYGINLTRRLFSGIKRLVEENNGHFIIFKEERSWELLDISEEKVYYLNGKYYKLSLGQHHETLKETLGGFEHYRIPMPRDNYTVSEHDEHLNPHAIDILMEELAFIISTKDYFK